LSATRGSNTGGDALPYKIRYANPRGSADPCGQMRMVVNRTGSEAGGISQTAGKLWDTGWLGAPSITVFPRGLRDFGCAQFRDRIYICGGTDQTGAARIEVWSAPLQGGSVGTWRRERDMQVRPNPTGGQITVTRYAVGCTAATFGNSGGSGSAGKGVGGTSWLIIYGGFETYGVGNAATATMIAAPILADGVLGDWHTVAYTGWTPYAYCDLLAVPNQYLTTSLVLSGGVSTLGGASLAQCWSTMVRNVPATAKEGNDWDVPGGWWTDIKGSGFPAVAGHKMVYDWANGTLLTLKGTNQSAGPPQTGFYYLGYGVDHFAWTYNTLGSTWGAGSATDNAQSNGAVVYFGAQSAGSKGGSPPSYVYIIGGTSAVNPGDASVAMTQVSYSTLTWNSSGVPTAGTWVHSGNTLPTAAAGCRAAIHEHGLQEMFGYPPWVDPNKVYVSVLGGGNNSTVGLSDTRSFSLPAVAGSGAWTTSGGNISSWINSGAGAGLANGDLGTGGSIAADTSSDAPAGAQVITINHGVITASGVLADGDSIQGAVWTSDKLGGDPAGPDYVSFGIGQAPTITNVTPANLASVTNGQPPISFSFNSGLGGSQEYAWQAQIKQGASVLFDTGIRYDQQNSVTPSLAPLLPPSQGTSTYTLIIQVWSSDFSTTGTSISTTSTTTFGTSAFTVLGVPGSFTATASGPNASVAFTWASVGSAVDYPIYYKRTGTSTWYLYVKPGNVTSYTGLDHLALGVGYDFSITSLSAVPAESAQSGTQAATIPLGTGSSYIHVAGQGATYGTWLQVQGSPTMAEIVDAKDYLGFGQGAPVTRYGVADYHTVGLEQTLLLDPTPALLKVVQAILDQVQAGQLCCYRDALGGQLVVTFGAQQTVSIKPPYYRQLALKLTEVADTVGPYVSSGSARGYQTLVGGRKPPLDTSERLL
jgi:hypothetical protein